MAITLRKAGTGPIKVPNVLSQPPADVEYRSPFRESYHQESAGTPSAVPQQEAVTDPVKAKPRAVFKITPGKSVRPGLPPPSPVEAKTTTDAALAVMGLADEPRELTNAERYPIIGAGEFIVVTNALFPWIKHYKPGDIARIKYSSLTHSHPEDPVYKYRAYFCEIVDGPRKGQTPMLFRWEFEPRKDSNPAPRIEGRVITQT
jgi:hypothetical protein